MNFSLIYTKTARGIAEIKSRSGTLTPAARRVLIMVDGKRTEAELELVVRDGEFEGIIEALVEKGMIEQSGSVETEEATPDWAEDEEATVMMDAAQGPDAIPALRPAPTMQQPVAALRPVPTMQQPAQMQQAVAEPQAKAVQVAAPPPPAPQPQAPTLEERKRAAVKALYDRLGPYGEEPASRIQDCKSLDALGDTLKHVYRRIVLFRGEQAAREYMAAIGQA
jgi:hypothetical protein